MKGLRPIRTVADLMAYLSRCPPEAEVSLVPEEGEGFLIGGVLEFSSEKPAQVWILIDEFSEADDGSQEMEWVSGSTEEGRAGDMGTLPEIVEEEDVVQVRGKLRSA